MPHREYEQVLALRRLRHVGPEPGRRGWTRVDLPHRRGLRGDCVRQHRHSAARLKIRRQLRDRLLQRNRIRRVPEGEARHANHHIRGHVVQIRQLVHQRRLQLDHRHAFAVERDPVRRNPSKALLQIGEADLRRGRRPPIRPFELERQQVAELFVRQLALWWRPERDVLNVVDGEGLHAVGGANEDDAALLRGSRWCVRQPGDRQFFSRALRNADDRARIAHRLAIRPDRFFRDDGFGPGVTVKELGETERGLFDQHAPLPRHHAGEPGVGTRRVRPERTEHGRRQVVHQDMAGRVGRQRTFVQHERVPILEDGYFLDGHSREGGQRRGGLGGQGGGTQKSSARENEWGSRHTPLERAEIRDLASRPKFLITLLVPAPRRSGSKSSSRTTLRLPRGCWRPRSARSLLVRPRH